MAETQLKDLLEAGVHFGHQSSRWNPKMKRYIFAARNGIHIIDLKKTVQALEEANTAVRRVTLDGNRVLFVCTKRQLRPIIEAEAARCGAFWVTERWLGGMLTNFTTIKKQIRRLKELERGLDEGSYEFYTKKEQLLLQREREKLEKYLGGVKDMGRLPGALFVVDAKKELIAVKEARKLGIPVIAIADTNADPDLIDFAIPGNDDAIRSVQLIACSIGDAIEQARRELPPEARRRADEVEAVTYSSEGGLAQDTSAQEGEKGRRRRPRRKRRPRPEVIANLRVPGEVDGDAEEPEPEEA
ncbi:MAG TPA: 30S ribosomal protein S2 [Longimicrobiales bacterium]